MFLRRLLDLAATVKNCIPTYQLIPKPEQTSLGGWRHCQSGLAKPCSSTHNGHHHTVWNSTPMPLVLEVFGAIGKENELLAHGKNTNN
jgi:hypothetical protein